MMMMILSKLQMKRENQVEEEAEEDSSEVLVQEVIEEIEVENIEVAEVQVSIRSIRSMEIDHLHLHKVREPINLATIDQKILKKNKKRN